MKRTLRVITAGACATGMAFALAGCTGQSAPESPSQSTSYESSQQSEEGSSSMNSQSSETSSSGAESQGANREESSYSFDPSGNENEDVYGPPGVFDPSENMVEALYGPPEMLKSRGSRMGFGDDESEGFDPALNDMAILYGPPSMFFDSEDELEWSEGDEDAAGGEVDVGDSDAGRTAGSGEANA